MFPRRLVLILSLSLCICPSVLDAFSIPSTRANTRAPLAASSSDETINHVTFEYCTESRWTSKAFWMAQELLTTFNDNNLLNAVTLMPSSAEGTFCVSHHRSGAKVLWDKASQGGSFPPLKQLKQLVRDQISPDLFLGHSDNKQQVENEDEEKAEEEQNPLALSTSEVLSQILDQEATKQPNVAIQYCTGCRWMLRSAYFGTELVTNLQDEIQSLTLLPSRPPEKGGIFTVTVNGEVVWDRAEQGGFPEAEDLLPIVKDKLSDASDSDFFDEMDDDDAAEMRAFYGVM